MRQPAGQAEHLQYAQAKSILENSPSHLLWPLLTTKVPLIPLNEESQIPVDTSKPTHVPLRLLRGDAQARQSEVLGPVQVEHAGEQLKYVSWATLRRACEADALQLPPTASQYWP